MGYRAKRTINTLKFEDPEMDGLVVRAGIVDMETILKIGDQAENLRAGGMLSMARGLFDTFMGREAWIDEETGEEHEQIKPALISWNLENEEGEPTPQTLAGLLSHEPKLVMTIVLAWFDSMVGISGPLEPNSTSGNTFPVDIIPMDVPSPNLTNLPALS